MKKTILAPMLVCIMTLACPMRVAAGQGIEIIENNVQGVSIVYSASVLRVTGGEGEVMYIYNVAGVRVMSVRVDGDDKSYELNLPKGCYIVKVGKFVRKISIR